MRLTDEEMKLIFTALNAQADRFAAMAAERSGEAKQAMLRNAELMRDLAQKIIMEMEGAGG